MHCCRHGPAQKITCHKPLARHFYNRQKFWLLCYTSKPLGKITANRTFFDWGRRAWHLRLGLGISKPTVKLDCTENGVVKLEKRRMQRNTKHTMLLVFVVLGGLRAGSATKFFKTRVITQQDICEMKSIWDTWSHEHRTCYHFSWASLVLRHSHFCLYT